METKKNLKQKIIKNISCLLLIGVSFFYLTYFSNTVLAAFDVSGVRPSAAFNPIFGIAFGWPAILACAIANFISDMISGFGTLVAFLGFIPQVLYGAIPYYVWKYLNNSISTRTRLDSPKKTIMFIILMAINAAIIGVAVGFIQYVAYGNSLWETAFFVFLNDFDMCLVFGFPILAIIDYIYSKVVHKGRRKLSANEIIILIASFIDIVIFIVMIIINLPKVDEMPREELWKKIFENTMTIINAMLIISIIAMYIYHFYKKKHLRLRIFEKKNGIIYVDENKMLEFVSFPERPFESRIKLSSQEEDLVKDKIPASFEDSWCVKISSQKGCNMNCLFCDAPAFGYHGNVSKNEMIYQIRTILESSGSTHTKLFEVDFGRMGESTFNPDTLDFIEKDLQKEIKKVVNADRILPIISTILPKSNENLVDYLKNYCRIKNEAYNGDAVLTFLINSTSDEIRNTMFQNMSLSLDEISKIAKELPEPKGKKYELSFSVDANFAINPAIIDNLFDKHKFCIKIIPLHDTFNAKDNEYEVVDVYDKYYIFQKLENKFKSLGWDTMIFMDKKEDDQNFLTNGNLLLSNINEPINILNNQKKKIGLVVAIEMDAIFKYYKKIKELPAPSGFRLFLVEKKKYNIYILQTGMGEVYAASGVQYLITNCNVSKIFNFGVVGGMTESISKSKVCIVERVVHYKYDCSEFMNLKVGQVDGHNSIYLRPDANLIKSALSIDDTLKYVTCCSGDKFVSTVDEKKFLNKTYNGEICDMESAGIVLACELNNTPCLLFKAVADGLFDGAEGYYAALEHASSACLEVADKVIEKLVMME